MTETEAKWTERIREWEKSGLPLEQFVEGKPYRASTFLWRKRQIEHRRRLAMGTQRRRGTGARSGDSRGERTVRTDRQFKPLAAPVTIAEVVRRPAASHESTPVVIEIGPARIRVAHGFDVTLLREVVRALQGAE